MKLGIVSDLHLGFNDDALEQAREALQKAAARCDVLLLPGDLFDARVPKQEVVHDGVKLFSSIRVNSGARLVELDAEGRERDLGGPLLLAVYGTHERRTKGLSNLIQIFDAAGLLVNCHARRIVVEKGGERVCVQGMGGVPEEYAATVVKSLDVKPVAGAFNVFLFHQTLRELIPQDEDAMAAADLPAGFDVYVDGHLHWRVDEVLSGKRVVVPGSTVITQLREREQEPKGFVVLDTVSGVAEFVPIHSRPFVYRELVFSEAGAGEVEAAVKRALEEIVVRGGVAPLVKLKLLGSLKPGLSPGAVDVRSVLGAFSGRALVSVDKAFEAGALREKIEALRQLREESVSARDRGVAFLKKRLEERGWALCDAEELFSLLGEGDVDGAVALVEKR